MIAVVKLEGRGADRVLDGEVGMTFVVDFFSDGVAGKVAHVRDYRFPDTSRGFQVWSIPADGYQILDDPTLK